MGLALIVFISAFLLTSSVGALIFYRQTALRRLSQMVSPPADVSVIRSITPVPGSKFAKLTKPFENVVPRTKDDLLTLQKRLHRAGYRETSAVNIFYGSK